MIKLAAMRLLVPVIGRFPWLFYRLAWLTGWVAFQMQPGRRRAVIANLRPFCRSHSEARRAALDAFRNVACYYVDLASFPRRDFITYERDHLTVVGEEHLAVLDGERPVIVVSGHAGNPELVLAALAARGHHFVALVEPLRPPAIARYVAHLREHAGGTFVEADMRGVRLCLQELRAGGLVGLLADRDLQRNGICVELAGRKLPVARGPWDLARRTGAIVLPAFSIRTRYADQVVYVEKPLCLDGEHAREAAVAALAQRWATLFEAHVRRDPGQWTVLENLWKGHPCG